MAKKLGTLQEEIAYTITLKSGREFNVRDSANAWWLNQHKVDKILVAFELGSTIIESCDYAGITLKQYKYFARIHPELAEIRKGFDSYPKIKARATLRKALEEPKYALKYLEKKVPGEFGTVDADAKVQEALALGWVQRKEDIKETLRLRQDARRLGLNVVGFTDTEDPMPWDPKDHRSEFSRMIEEVSRGMVKRMDEARAESVRDGLIPLGHQVA
jgi:hypothetical protein